MLETKRQNFEFVLYRALARSIVTAFIVLVFFSDSPALSPLNVWRSSGPAAAVYNVVVDPFDQNIVYASGYAGVYRSIDNGASWSSLDLDIATDLEVDLFNPGVIYAVNEGRIYKSTNRGLAWTILNSPRISTITVSATDPNFIVAANFNGICVTNNGGASWETRPINPAPDYLDALEIDPQDPNNIYMSYVWGGESWVAQVKSNDAGATWTPFHHGGYVGAFNADSLDPSIVYMSACVGLCSSSSGFYKSTNGGANWTLRGMMPTYISQTFAISPQGPNAIYAATPTYVPTHSDGIYRSLDDGAGWSLFNEGLPLPRIGVFGFAFDRSASYLHAATSSGVYSVRLRPTYVLAGRVLTPSGNPLRNASVSITDLNGIRRTATTSSFGIYAFSDIREDTAYTISATSRRYRFASQTITVTSDLGNVDLVGLE